MRAFATSAVVSLAVLGVLLARGPAFADNESATGSIMIDVTDAAKKGVAGITITAKVGGAEQSATTGSEQPSDTELAAAARTGGKAIETLNSQYNARASITGLPLGTVTITLDAKGAKPITIAITADKLTWKLTATVDGKSKKLIGTPKVVFDEVANARAQAEQAKAEVAKAKAAQGAAKAEQERAKAAQEQARSEQERAKANAAESDADAKRARDTADAEKLKRQRQEAPSRISVAPLGCQCGSGHTIIVTCKVASTAEVPVDVAISAFAETGTFGVDSSGKRDLTGLAAGQAFDLQVTTSFSAFKDCSSCKSSKCTLGAVVPK